LFVQNAVNVTDAKTAELVCPRCEQKNDYSFLTNTVSVPMTWKQKLIFWLAFAGILVVIAVIRAALGYK
jgi:hypothetical protein